jgi:sulfite oxidase
VVTRVELSHDGGLQWTPARLLPAESAWTWTFWEASLQLAHGQYTLIARATDSSGATQPADLADTWNVKGYANNAWHRVSVQVGSRLPRGARRR